MLLVKKIGRKIRYHLSFIMFRIKHPCCYFFKGARLAYNSQDGQDFLVYNIAPDYFESQGERYIVDVGCNRPIKYSNSLFFERVLGCKVLAIDPIAEYSLEWAKRRPTAIFVNSAISLDHNSVSLFVPLHSNNEIADMFSSVGKSNEKINAPAEDIREVAADRLSNILSQHGVDEIKLLSVDVEGAELEVLKSIDFMQVSIGFILVENNELGYFGSEKIRTLLVGKGFVFFARISGLDDLFVNKNLITKGMHERIVELKSRSIFG